MSVEPCGASDPTTTTQITNSQRRNAMARKFRGISQSCHGSQFIHGWGVSPGFSMDCFAGPGKGHSHHPDVEGAATNRV